MTTDQQQAAINADAIVWLADLLEHAGLPDPVPRAEHVVHELISRGIGRANPIPPRRPTRVASDATRAAALAEARAAITAARTRSQETHP